MASQICRALIRNSGLNHVFEFGLCQSQRNSVKTPSVHGEGAHFLRRLRPIVHIAADSGIQAKITSTVSRRTKVWVSACENAFQIASSSPKTNNATRFSPEGSFWRSFPGHARGKQETQSTVFGRDMDRGSVNGKSLFMARMCTCRKVIATPTKFTMMSLS